MLSILTIIAPVSAGTVHVYPGDNIGAKLQAAASGDTVYVHAGSYTLNAGPILDNMSLTIIGDGASSTVINFVGAGTRMYFYMYPGPGRTINISGITFKGDSTSTPNNLLEFYNDDSSTYTMMDVKVTDCVFDKASGIWSKLELIKLICNLWQLKIVNLKMVAPTGSRFIGMVLLA